MVGWGEVVPDIILLSFYSFLLLRIATASDVYFKTPFFVFFLVTGVYNMITVVSFLIVGQFLYTESNPTVHIFKVSYALNSIGAVASTIGKMFIDIHRYSTLRKRDFSENGWSKSTVGRLLVIQFIISSAASIPVWPSDYEYRTVNGVAVISALSKTNILILKAIFVSSYLIYIICNAIMTTLSSRELCMLGSVIEGNPETSRMLVANQRNMFIVVIASSISHLIKAAHQTALFIATYLHLDDFTAAIWPFYPITNGLATYVSPLILVMFSSKVRSLFRINGINSSIMSMTSTVI